MPNWQHKKKLSRYLKYMETKHKFQTKVSKEQRFFNEEKQMNISDLQYIESVDASEVQGAGGKWRKYLSKGKGKGGKYKLPTASLADATAFSRAVGGKVNVAVSDTYSVASPGGSESYSSSTALTLGTLSDHH